uniref:Uncharacterized protein n=1 Tax=Gopherus evgoodei TaxID=1825980 RepID=A0A8C4VWQ0_9SAUR
MTHSCHLTPCLLLYPKSRFHPSATTRQQCQVLGETEIQKVLWKIPTWSQHPPTREQPFLRRNSKWLSNTEHDLKFSTCQKFCSIKCFHSPPEGSGCKLCPPNWLLHRDKCYWVSKEKTPWNKSRDVYSKRNARLLMIRDQDEMVNKTSGEMSIIRSSNSNWRETCVTSYNPRAAGLSSLTLPLCLISPFPPVKQTPHWGVFSPSGVSG